MKSHTSVASLMMQCAVELHTAVPVLRRSLAGYFAQPRLLTAPRYNDLIPEESEIVQKAIKRLPSKEAYDRVFRIRRAFQVRPNPFLSGSTKV